MGDEVFSDDEVNEANLNPEDLLSNELCYLPLDPIVPDTLPPQDVLLNEDIPSVSVDETSKSEEVRWKYKPPPELEVDDSAPRISIHVKNKRSPRGGKKIKALATGNMELPPNMPSTMDIENAE